MNRPPRSRAAVCSCCRRGAGWLTPGRSVVLAAMRPANARAAGGRRLSRISRVSPVNTSGVWSGRNLPPRQPSHTPRAAGRRPRLLHLSGSPLVSTSGAWLGQCLPPQRPLGCKAILTSSARFVNPRRPSGKMHKISLSIQATLAKSPVIWKARLTFPSCRAILHPWKANFPRKEAAR